VDASGPECRGDVNERQLRSPEQDRQRLQHPLSSLPAQAGLLS